TRRCAGTAPRKTRQPVRLRRVGRLPLRRTLIEHGGRSRRRRRETRGTARTALGQPGSILASLGRLLVATCIGLRRFGTVRGLRGRRGLRGLRSTLSLLHRILPEAVLSEAVPAVLSFGRASRTARSERRRERSGRIRFDTTRGLLRRLG